MSERRSEFREQVTRPMWKPARQGRSPLEVALRKTPGNGYRLVAGAGSPQNQDDIETMPFGVVRQILKVVEHLVTQSEGMGRLTGTRNPGDLVRSNECQLERKTE